MTYLKYFVDAASHKSITAAARSNFVSQSAISQGIAKLEIELGVKLTTHQKQAFNLTEEGIVVFNEAKKIFFSITELKDNLGRLNGKISGEIKFACTNSLAQYFVPSFYIQMKQEYPQVDLKFHRGSLEFIHQALRSEKVKFALVLDGNEFDNYDSQVIHKGSFGIYTKMASDQLLVDHLDNYEVIELRKRYKAKYGKELEILAELSGWSTVLSFIQQGYGDGFLPDFVAKNQKLTEIELDIAPIHYAIIVIKLRGASLTRAERKFIEKISSVSIS